MSATSQPSDLEATFASRGVRAADADYDERRKIFNGMFDRRPSMIARCRTTNDVVAAVNYARENQLPVSVYSGGHGVTGHAVCDEGLVIDMREFAQVSVDPGTKTARVGGMWMDPAEDEANIAWAREFGQAIKPYTRGGPYLNFIGEEGGDRVREAFGPEKFARLQALKDQYDPGNLFRLNQNIPPSGG